ncbi:MAG: glycosyltransferase family 2 protein [Candidatus Cloacimonetes bacterium]|nr:glycosyltransferase family 2 protein [Candidatus Cloacimonadota bacterium]
MIYLALFILLIALIRFFTALINFIFTQPLKTFGNENQGLVSILIPARNEENNIGKLLNDVENQTYDNIEVIVFNDMSTDNTAEIVNSYSQWNSKIRLVNSLGLPDNWLGKNHACHSLASLAKGDYLLFLDADVSISGDVIERAVSTAKKFNLGLLSVFPVQIMITPGEKITVPNMTNILLSLLPLVFVRISWFSSHSAANGQFMLFERERYLKHMPHQKFKMNRVEDIEIARFYKKSKIKIACITGVKDIKCRMYSGFNEAVNGFSKNVVNFFGNSFILAITYWLLTTFGFIFVLIALPIEVFVLYLAMIVLTRIMISVSAKQNISDNFLYAVPQQISLGIFIFKAVSNKFKKNLEWKGRNIY